MLLPLLSVNVNVKEANEHTVWLSGLLKDKDILMQVNVLTSHHQQHKNKEIFCWGQHNFEWMVKVKT